MDDITVIHRGDDAFAVMVRDHVIHVDQPYSAGGMDEGPTPVELFVAALAACAAHHGRRYLATHRMPAEGLEVSARFTMTASTPPRVTGVDLAVRSPIWMPETHTSGLLAAVQRCTVHNALLGPPDIAVHVEALRRTA